MKHLVRPAAAILMILLLITAAGCGGRKNDSPTDPASPADGVYQAAVTLTGGTGRASVESPAQIMVSGGNMTARIVWSSANYDYMIVDGVRYEPEILDGHSVFEIPVELDKDLPVIGDTTAMSTPHEIEYVLHFDSATLTEVTGPDWSSLAPGTEVPVSYATQFRITKYADGYRLIDIDASGRFLVVPQGKIAPKGLPEDVTVLSQPLDRIYLTATSSMDFFRALDGISAIRLSGTNASGWYIPEAKAAMEDGRILFAGKYSAPDFELIFSEHCDLAVESTMIYHSPEIKEQLEKIGVPVLVERSSYEEHPLGRMEWIKVYGILLGKEEEAARIFDQEAAAVEELPAQSGSGKTVAFFYINSSGTVNVRKSEDYVPRMIEMGGGQYVFSDLDSGSALSTVNMTMEAFYTGAKNADVLIYNSTIDGELKTVDELLAKSKLLADFKAVQSGDVWCTGKNLFQEPMGLGQLIGEIYRVLSGDVPADGQLTYLHRLQNGN